jgi:hypothetical protein
MTNTAMRPAQTNTHACNLTGEATAAQCDPPSSGYVPLPAGDYVLEIVESAVHRALRRAQTILKTKAQVVGGPYAGRLMYLNYTIQHRRGTAQEIGQRDFAALRRAVGVHHVVDSEQLHFRPFHVTIGVRTRDGEPENVIKKYHFEGVTAANDNCHLEKAA